MTPFYHCINCGHLGDRTQEDKRRSTSCGNCEYHTVTEMEEEEFFHSVYLNQLGDFPSRDELLGKRTRGAESTDSSFAKDSASEIASKANRAVSGD